MSVFFLNKLTIVPFLVWMCTFTSYASTVDALEFSQLFEIENDSIKVDYDTSAWTEITEKDGFVLDIKYATAENFTKQVIYDCARCFVRPEVAVLLKELQNNLITQGFKLKLFDCYRPKQAQQLLWDIVPNINYVTPPEKGSMHNRGLAVDVTLVDSLGIELDMGTRYDYFGKEAHIEYLDLSPEIKKNRVLLLSNLKRVGLSGIKTEWWHYSLKNIGAELSDWEWECK